MNYTYKREKVQGFYRVRLDQFGYNTEQDAIQAREHDVKNGVECGKVEAVKK